MKTQQLPPTIQMVYIVVQAYRGEIKESFIVRAFMAFSFSVMGLTQLSSVQELCAWLCALYCTMSVGGWPLTAEGAQLRCGSELLGDLIFVCGDRGVHLGKSTS